MYRLINLIPSHIIKRGKLLLELNMRQRVESGGEAAAQAAVARGNGEEILALFNQAFIARDWQAIKVFCDMPEGPTKPYNAQKDWFLSNALQRQDWTDVHNIEKAFKTAEHEMVEGPRMKSKYTTQLEELTRKMMSPIGGEFKVQQIRGEDIFVFKDGSHFNWSRIREHANFQDISLEQKDFDTYGQYMQQKGDSVAKCTLSSDKEGTYRDALYAKYHETHQPLPDPPISFQEMQAINVYSSSFYSPMNKLMRGVTSGEALAGDKERTRAALIQSVMCASGLRRVPETMIEKVYRAENMISTERIAAAVNKGVVTMEGFVSTSTSSSIYQNKDYVGSNVQMTLSNVRGVYIQPISAFGAQLDEDKKDDDEQEFLILPTQVRLTDYQAIKSYNGSYTHRFEGECVSDLACLSEKSLAKYLDNKEPVTTFDLIVSEMADKLKELEVRADKGGLEHDKFEVVKELLTSLEQARKSHVAGDISGEQFVRQCETAIEKATPTLEQHSRILGKLFAGLKAAIFSLVKPFLGASIDKEPEQIKQTKSAGILQSMRAELNSCRDSQKSTAQKDAPAADKDITLPKDPSM